MSPEAESPKSYVAKRLQLLTDFVNDPRSAEVLAEGGVHPARALVLRAVMATPGLPKFLYNNAYTRHYKAAGHEILGIGYHAITVADGPNAVRKFFRRTAGQTEAQQQQQIKELEHKQASALTHLAEYTVPQHFFIQENPLNPQESVVAATQARINIQTGINFYLGADAPAADPSDFAASALEMQENSDPHALPDVVGVNNLVVEADTGAILLIDPVSLHADDPIDVPSYERAQRILERVSVSQK